MTAGYTGQERVGWKDKTGAADKTRKRWKKLKEREVHRREDVTDDWHVFGETEVRCGAGETLI